MELGTSWLGDPHAVWDNKDPLSLVLYLVYLFQDNHEDFIIYYLHFWVIGYCWMNKRLVPMSHTKYHPILLQFSNTPNSSKVFLITVVFLESTVWDTKMVHRPCWRQPEVIMKMCRKTMLFLSEKTSQPTQSWLGHSVDIHEVSITCFIEKLHKPMIQGATKIDKFCKLVM